jgi:hypothetical protein
LTPIVGIAIDDGSAKGCWIVDVNGQVYGYGNTHPVFHQAVVQTVRGPMVGIAATANGKGYWILSENGNVYSFGNASGDATFTSTSVTLVP